MSLAIGVNVLFAAVFVGLWAGVTYLTYRSWGRAQVHVTRRVQAVGADDGLADRHGELPAA